jgi:hypothetical protein
MFKKRFSSNATFGRFWRCTKVSAAARVDSTNKEYVTNAIITSTIAINMIVKNPLNRYRSAPFSCGAPTVFGAWFVRLVTVTNGGRDEDEVEVEGAEAGDDMVLPEDGKTISSQFAASAAGIR